MGNSNKSFGYVFGFFFLILFIYLFTAKDQINFYLIFVSLIFFILGSLNAKILTPLNKIWSKIGIFLSKITSPIIMGFIFFFIVTPIGILMKIAGKDLLRLKFNEEKTYWIKKSGPKSKMKNQF
jgi:hypothetical protein